MFYHDLNLMCLYNNPPVQGPSVYRGLRLLCVFSVHLSQARVCVVHQLLDALCRLFLQLKLLLLELCCSFVELVTNRNYYFKDDWYLHKMY